MTWEAPSFVRIPTGTELGYVNELEPDGVPAAGDDQPARIPDLPAPEEVLHQPRQA
jgi:hypothetical protein